MAAAAAVVQLAGRVFVWHMIEWFSTACCLLFIWSTFKKCNYPLCFCLLVFT
jgi:hypothetical protein